MSITIKEIDSHIEILKKMREKIANYLNKHGIEVNESDGADWITSTRNYTINIRDFKDLKMAVVPISIFGSCVSRDMLEYDSPKHIELKTYIARQSIVSAVSSEIKCKKEDIQLESEFQKRLVFNDLTKKTFETLKNDQSTFIIIDLIDERFKLVTYDNSFATLSNEMLASKYFGEKPLIVDKILGSFEKTNEYYVQDIALETYIDLFCEKITSIYEQQKIIIHKAIMLNEYVTKEGDLKKFLPSQLSNNKKINQMLEYMYNCLKRKLPNAFTIDVCDKFHADENHKWGLAPMHYQQEYYDCALSYIYRYLKSFEKDN